MLELAVAIVAAAGTIISAYVAAKVRVVSRRTNGELDELQARVELLESVLAWSAGAPAPGDEEPAREPTYTTPESRKRSYARRRRRQHKPQSTKSP